MTRTTKINVAGFRVTLDWEALHAWLGVIYANLLLVYYCLIVASWSGGEGVVQVFGDAQVSLFLNSTS